MINSDFHLPVFVSLTVISSRLSKLPAVIKTLLRQSRPPNKVILNISREPHMLDRGVRFEGLPIEVRRMIGAGEVEAYQVENTGSYRKLIPTLRRFHEEDCVIVTADDDVLYPERWLEGLCSAHAVHGCIAAYRTREIRLWDGGGMRPYQEWPYSYELPHTAGIPSMNRVPTGRGGVLYRGSYFRNLDLLERFKQLAPGQDDMSFRIATILAGIPVVWIPYVAEDSLKEFHGFHYDDSLFAKNSLQIADTTPNDAALAALLDHCRARNLVTPSLKLLLSPV